MKKIIKKASVSIITLALTSSVYLSTPVYAAKTPLSTSDSSFKAFTISSSGTQMYATAFLNDYETVGWIQGSDEILISSVVKNKITGRLSAKASISTPNGSRTAWIAYDSVTVSRRMPKKKIIAAHKIKVYRRPAGTTIGYIEKGDKVYVLGSKGMYKNVLIYKMNSPSATSSAWITSYDYDSLAVSGSKSYAAI